MNLYDELSAAVLPRLEAYETDLTTHDKKWIEENSGVPFLHWTRPTGTELIGLLPADRLPKAGDRVPFLFGTADRRHLVKSVLSVAKAEMKIGNVAWHYYDGAKLRVIDAKAALKVAEDYRRKMETMFDDEEKKARNLAYSC